MKREEKTNPRARGTNPRAQFTNPRRDLERGIRWLRSGDLVIGYEMTELAMMDFIGLLNTVKEAKM